MNKLFLKGEEFKSLTSVEKVMSEFKKSYYNTKNHLIAIYKRIITESEYRNEFIYLS